MDCLLRMRVGPISMAVSLIAGVGALSDSGTHVLLR